jgi:hypothetical protein
MTPNPDDGKYYTIGTGDSLTRFNNKEISAVMVFLYADCIY